MRDPTRLRGRGSSPPSISIHRSLAGPDANTESIPIMAFPFQSTGPLRDPTFSIKCSFRLYYISIHRSLAGPDYSDCFYHNIHSISIHRSLAGPDSPLHHVSFVIFDFNPQVPCGTRPAASFTCSLVNPFQSTGPLRDPTSLFDMIPAALKFQSTGPLRDPTIIFISYNADLAFQSTGPLRDPTCPLHPRPTTPQKFQSTGPLRDPTLPFLSSRWDALISIHRSLAGPDEYRSRHYPIPFVFQSTGPLRDPTRCQPRSKAAEISIHRSLAGPDSWLPYSYQL